VWRKNDINRRGEEEENEREHVEGGGRWQHLKIDGDGKKC